MRTQKATVKMTRIFTIIITVTALFAVTFYSTPAPVSALPNDVLGIENNCTDYIKNVSTGHYLDVYGGAPAVNGQNVVGSAGQIKSGAYVRTAAENTN